jgi:DNA-binding NarL/FixJ family response regulator
MEAKKKHIAIADDQVSFAQSVAHWLEKEGDFSVQAILTDYDTITTDIKKYNIDLLLLDVNFGERRNAINLLEQLKKENDLIIVIFTSHDTQYIKTRALNKGADGFIDKYKELENLKSLVEDYLNGIIKVFTINNDVIKITTRENKIVDLLYEGNSEKEIADQLHISITTVKTHKKNLFQKLNVQKQSELIKSCIEHGILIV